MKLYSIGVMAVISEHQSLTKLNYVIVTTGKRENMFYDLYLFTNQTLPVPSMIVLSVS